MFRLLTGLKCPGCGVSRMCLCLLKGDLPGAWQHNPAILCMLPVWAAMAVHSAGQYVLRGTYRLSRWVTALAWVSVAVLVVFGILRNL